ncbi:MAG: serine/threonine protein kinase [Planctomycetales bacterium]|nr:serine/threonine protein kinase [Planctomycetales bacterium]
MGVVYKARDTQLNRLVALKMILSGQLASQQDVGRFRQEAEAAAKLDHSGIVPIYEIGEVGGQHFYSMKLIEGGSLADRLPKLRKNTRATVSLLEKVARAVHFAHQRGILHRDLKPANILLDENDEPSITDLGLAKQLHSDSNITQSGAIVGTPAYMPPEQATASKQITTAADIYAIGAILYEALTGRPPHKADSPVETLMQVMEGKIKRPRERNPRVHKTLDLICMKCLEREPSQRYTSAAALADDLRSWLEGTPVSVRPRSFTSTVGEVLLCNLRSAVGAAIVGMISGLLFAYCLSRAHSSNDVITNPPLTIYQQLPAEMPVGRNLVFLQETETDGRAQIPYVLAFTGIVGWVGWVVAMVTRSKPGSESFAYGLIAAFLMATMLFIFLLGSPHRTYHALSKRIGDLAKASIGPEGSRASAREQLFKDYPGLRELPSEDRANALRYRNYYDSIYDFPIHTLGAIVSVSVWALLPCITGSCFASKLRKERGRIRSTLLPYSEFALLLAVLTTTFWLQTLLPYFGERGVPQIIVGEYVAQLVLYSFIVAMMWLIYRRTFSWKTRLGIYVAFISFCWWAVS